MTDPVQRVTTALSHHERQVWAARLLLGGGFAVLLLGAYIGAIGIHDGLFTSETFQQRVPYAQVKYGSHLLNEGVVRYTADQRPQLLALFIVSFTIGVGMLILGLLLQRRVRSAETGK